MKHSLQLRLSQHLTLTPQLQQSIRLLQLSTVELNQEIEKFLTDNPLLEREDGSPNEPEVAPQAPPPGEPLPNTQSSAEDSAPASGEESATNSDSGEFSNEEFNYGTPRDDDNDEAGSAQLAAEEQSLRAYLVAQLPHIKLSERDQQLLTLLIDWVERDEVRDAPMRGRSGSSITDSVSGKTRLPSRSRAQLDPRAIADPFAADSRCPISEATTRSSNSTG